MDITRWSTPKSDYILCSQRWRSFIQSAKTKLGADCGSDYELLIAKFRHKLKKGGKTIWPFKYDLKQILNDYTVEVGNRFKGLDLVDRVPDELWNRRQWPRPSPRKKKCKKAKSKGEQERYTHLNAEFQKIARRDKKGFLSDQCKEIEESNRMGKTRGLIKKIRDSKGTFHAKMGSIKYRNGRDLTEADI